MKRAVYFFLCSLLVLVFIQPLFQPLEPYRVRTVEPYETVVTNEVVQLQTNRKRIRITLNAAPLSEQVQETELLGLWNEVLKASLERAGYQVYYTDPVSEPVKDEQEQTEIFLSFSFRTSISQEPAVTLFTRPRNEWLVELGRQMAFQLQKTNSFTYLGLDTDHYENFPVLTPDNSLLIQISYPEGSFQRLQSLDVVESSCQAITEAFLLTPEP